MDRNGKRKIASSNTLNYNIKRPKTPNQNRDKQMKQFVRATSVKESGHMKVAPEFLEYIYLDKKYKNDVSTLSKGVVEKYFVLEDQHHV